MKKNRVFIIGEKESFIIRVLLQKLNAAGMEADFVKAGVNTINASLEGNEKAQLVYFVETDETIPRDVRNYLIDKLKDEDRQFILIGDANDNKKIIDNMPGDLIYKAFDRPVNNDAFVKTVSDLFGKIEAGEFRKSILIVDDDPSYMGLVREWLKSE